MAVKFIDPEVMKSEVQIGASQVAAIVGYDPWQTAYELWQIKTGRREKPPQTEAMKFGLEMEDETFRLYEQAVPHKEKAQRQVCAQHQEFEFLRCFADAWYAEEKCLVELKSPSSDRLLRSMQRGVVPAHYQLQCAAMMDIFDVETCDFFVAHHASGQKELLPVSVWDNWGDELSLGEFWETYAKPAIREFWEAVSNDRWPDQPAEVPEDKWLAAITRRQYAQQKIEEFEELKAEADSELKCLMGLSNSACAAGWRANWERVRPSWKATLSFESQEAMNSVMSVLATLRGKRGVSSVQTKISPESRRFVVREAKS